MVRRNQGRYALTLLILTAYTFCLGWFTSGYFYSALPLILAWLITTPVVAYFLGLVWRYDLVPRDIEASTVEKSAKRKRQAIDDVLRDLSDDDLLRLQQRLQNGTIDDELLYEQLGEDGEWVRNQRKR